MYATKIANRKMYSVKLTDKHIIIGWLKLKIVFIIKIFLEINLIVIFSKLVFLY